MILSDISIKQPVFATMMVVALLVLGAASYMALSVDLFPDIDFPFVIISVTYPGASAETVEFNVSKKIEDACNTIAGVKHMESTSQEGHALVLIEFTLETRGLDAAAEVRDKVAGIRGQLPTDIEEPIIQRYDPEAQPIISLSISGPQNLRDLTDYVDNEIRPRLENVSGVGAATIVGGAEREIQVRLDPDRLRSFDLSPGMIANKLAAANLEVPGGRMVDGNREWIVRTMGRFKTVDQIKNLVILTPHGRLVRLSEVADVLDTEKEMTSASRLNGLTAVGLEIRRQSGANTVDVADGVKKKLDEVRTELPSGMEIVVARDASVFIKDAIDDVLVNIAYGGTLAIIVIFLFLANGRSTIISGIAIPASIIATFTLMRMLGFTINFMTLLGLSLAVGLLIDDAIVVIENIYRHMEMGKTPMQAARDATNEIGLAVSATTFSIMVVFIPVAFMSGIVGQFFYSFGMTVAFAIAVSLFIAFTLTPMMSSRFLLPQKIVAQTKSYRRLRGWNNMFRHIEQKWYKPTLRWCLNHRLVTLFFATLAFVGSIMLAPYLGSEFLPLTDQNFIMVSFTGRTGDKLTSVIRGIEPVENMLMEHPEVVSVLTTIGSGTNAANEGSMYVKLVDRGDRDIAADSMVKLVRSELTDIPGFFFTVAYEESEGGNNKPVELSVRGPDLDQLEIYADTLMLESRTIPGLVDLESSAAEGKPELRVEVNRDMMADLGVSVSDVASTIRSFIDGDVVSRLKEGDDEYDIRLQIREDKRHDPASLQTLGVKSSKDIEGRDRFVVPINQIAQVIPASGPAEIKRYNRMREVRVSGNVADVSAGEVRDSIFAVADSMKLMSGYQITPVGEAEIQAESFASIGQALILAIIFIYLVLASQYNSFVDPLAIMVSQPLAIVGAILGLWVFGSAISIMSLIGIVLLMGLVTKNAILLVDFAKQRRAQGMERNEAILEAGPIRFRPIMMTALSTILGVLPLALAIGSGAELRAPIARAVIGGMISSTLLTLLVIPVVYTMFDDLAHGNFRVLIGLKPKPKRQDIV